MRTTEIVAVERAMPEPQELQGFSLELPSAGTARDAYSFDFGGWVLGRESAAVKIELVANDGPVRVVPIVYPRADVARAYPRNIRDVECWVSRSRQRDRNDAGI